LLLSECPLDRFLEEAEHAVLRHILWPVNPGWFDDSPLLGIEFKDGPVVA
jgi:hypothetical protein